MVKSERRAKMAAVERAAKLAAAAEALADEKETSTEEIETRVSSALARDASRSPSARDGDDAAALASMREKERAQFAAAEAALARARASRAARDALLAEERAKWARVLEVARSESGKAAAEAEKRARTAADTPGGCTVADCPGGLPSNAGKDEDSEESKEYDKAIDDWKEGEARIKAADPMEAYPYGLPPAQQQQQSLLDVRMPENLWRNGLREPPVDVRVAPVLLEPAHVLRGHHEV